MPIANVNAKRCCAFCRNWYDPANSCIRPKNPRNGNWEYDAGAKNRCMLSSFRETRGGEVCSNFESKF